MVRKTKSARTTPTSATARSASATVRSASATRKAPPQRAKAAARAPARTSPADTTRRLRSPRVLVPVAIAVGLCIAAVRKIAMAAANHGPRALPRMAREISPRFADAVHALGDLGRELRAKLR